MLSDRDDVKIFILYILNCVGYPLEYDVLYDMSVQVGFVTAFDYIDAFEELLETGNLMRTSGEDGKDLISITENGKHIAETLNGRLLLSVKEKAMKSALRLLSFKKKGTRIASGVTELSRGKYEFKCTITDNSGDVMELKLVLDNQKQADLVAYNFDSRPEFIYKCILALLSGEVDYLLD